MLRSADLLLRSRLAELFGAGDDTPTPGGASSQSETSSRSEVSSQTEASSRSGLGVAWDNRRVKHGDVFFALPGADGHGVTYAADALARDAAYVVSDRPFEGESDNVLLVADSLQALKTLGSDARSHLRSEVVAITGSAGKTTTKSMVTAVLAGRSTPGNLNTVPALVAALVQAAREDLAEHDSTSNDHRGALAGTGGPGSPLILELGIDRPGEMDELLDLCRPDHGIVTTIGESHLSALGDVQGVAREKSLLLERVNGAKLVGPGAAAMLKPELAAQTQIVTPKFTDDGVLSYLGECLVLPWPGRALAENALLALAIAARLGVGQQAAIERLLAVEFEGGRLRQFEVGDLLVIDDSYNANPLSVALALEVLHGLPAPRAAILGDMRELGSVSRQRHLELGSATRDLDVVIAVGPAAAAIAETNPAAITAADHLEACALLRYIPQRGSVLVKGSRSLGLERVVAALESREAGGTTTRRRARR